MSIRASQSKRRALVVLNYVSIFALMAVIYAGEVYGEKSYTAAAAIALMVISLLKIIPLLII